VTGEPLFGLDVKKEGMLIAMIEHAPAFGMKLKSVDASQAEAMPGIRQVFPINCRPEGFEPQWCDLTAFPELVVVVGETTWQVMQAKKALNIEWEQASEGESSAEHANKLTAIMEQPAEKPSRQDGDMAATFEAAEQVIDRRYRAPFLAHNTLEPMNFFAHVTADKAELEGPVQTPAALRKSAANILGLPEDKVSVMLTRMGGGFGRRLYGNFGLEAALISQKAKAPIKLVYTREDDMTQGTYRPAYEVRYRAALDSRGQLTGFHIRGAGIPGSPVFTHRYPAGAVENYLVENHHLDTAVSTGAWRAPRSNFIAFAEQAFLNEVAAAAGQDPIDFRLALFERAMTDPVGEKNDYDPARYAGVLKLVREKSSWDQKQPGLFRGVSAYFSHNSYVAQVVDLVMEDDKPKLKKVWCAVDCGIVVNPDAAKNQIEGSIIDGYGHAMYSALTLKDGKPEQNNFHQYRMIRHREAPPEIEVFFVESDTHPTGLGEPALPPMAAAFAAAYFEATGERLYEQPFTKGGKVELAS
jgi:isoquinoline 1-oxidoreductase subunit beta